MAEDSLELSALNNKIPKHNLTFVKESFIIVYQKIGFCIEILFFA
jgi:hypothetical protein